MGGNDNRKRMGGGATGILTAGILALSISGMGCESSLTNESVEDLDTQVLEAMAEAIQDEFRAEMIYERVLAEHGDVRPFHNIIYAEERHSEAIARLYQSRGLDVPESSWRWEEIPSFASVAEACQAGVEAEIENAEIYERYFSLELPYDVERVFESNRAASLNNHLPAFERCS